jgi:hypothetical protein
MSDSPVEVLVLSRFVGASKYTNQGQCVVAGQRLMQAALARWLSGHMLPT